MPDGRRYGLPMEPVRRWSTRRWVALDVAGLLSAAAVVQLVWPDGVVGRGLGWAGGAITVMLLALAVLRRVLSPVALGTAAVLAAVLAGSGPSSVPLVAATALIYTVAGRLSRWPGLLVLIAGVVCCLLGTTGFLRGSLGAPARWGIGAVAVPALALVTSWAAGYAVDRQRRFTTALHDQIVLAEREQIASERQALAEERLRIAREIHDVVAHTLAVITVQAGVAAHLADEQPTEARRALDSIEQTSRGASAEMRSLLTVLRPDRPPEATAPPPGLADLPALAARSEAAGLHVDLTVDGQPQALTSGADLTAYRVIQESVTNVLRHADTDRCEVRLVYRPSMIVIEVTDSGRGPRRGRGSGHGLIGMRERLTAYGGRLTAGPQADGGFQVRAELPVPGPAA
jgi:signal transduction histidine kinase